MRSRSGLVKLKAILIIDLLIVAAATGVYFYLMNEGTITVGAKPAALTVTSLTFSPAEPFVGESVLISANVSNTGDVEGNVTWRLKINGAEREALNITLAAKSSELYEFNDLEMKTGNYSVTFGDAAGYFIVREPPPETSKITLSSFKSTPYEIWPNQTTTVTATASNPSSEHDRLTIRVALDGVIVNTTLIELDAGASQTVAFTLNSTVEGKHTVKLNSLTGSFTVVKEGYHTLTINRSGGGSKSLPFTLNGEEHGTPYQALLPVGEYSISVPTPFDVGTGVLAFTSWSDGAGGPSRTFTLNQRLILVVTYTLISGYASCPSLFIWNGTDYIYVTDVSNTGWLGYIGSMNADGSVVYTGGNPWDYVRLDRNAIVESDGSYSFSLFQQWDELYYLDQAYMVVVDHPAGTDVYSTMNSYMAEGNTGQIYTVNPATLKAPLSATNEKGQDVSAQIAAIDRVFTPGTNGFASASWDKMDINQLTLDLGDLSDAPQVKLVVNGMIDWGDAGPYYTWIDSFKAAAAKGLIPDGTVVYPPPYLEVQAANGSWIKAPMELPNPSDFNCRDFVIDLTGVFPADVTDYKVRIMNFFNVTYDYIALDTSVQQNITIQQLNPSSAVLSQIWDTQSKSSGAFTRYGDVTPLVQGNDDMYVIGRQGDQVDIKFSADSLAPVAEGMQRDYFFYVACWFKDPPGAWGYGFDFTVNPMPFSAMSGFPYSSAESYPTDAAHLAYLQQYNTRIIP